LKRQTQTRRLSGSTIRRARVCSNWLTQMTRAELILATRALLRYNVGAVFELLPAHAVTPAPARWQFNDVRGSPAPASACVAEPLGRLILSRPLS
ncbi:MAG TPA: hypothetical protein VE821_04225, partial [Pyrinomonadaceae bacterium]|nr:hypothetical protein [Pyrinomonadaceae bacterium]